MAVFDESVVMNPLVMYKSSLNKALFLGVAAALVSTAPISMPATASSAVQRCQSPDGALIYTDRACAAAGGKAVPMSAELRARIASAAAHEQSQGLSRASLSRNAFPWADAAMPAPAPARVSRRSAAAGCARTPTQLAMDLRGSLALGDVNRLAESYHWPGMNTRQGRQTMERLQHLIGSQVIESQYFNAQISSVGIADAAGNWLATADASTRSTGIGGGAGVLQLVLGDTMKRLESGPSTSISNAIRAAISSDSEPPDCALRNGPCANGPYAAAAADASLLRCRDRSFPYS